MSSLALQCEQVATVIANRIAQDAFWHEDRCNWVGAQPNQRVGGAAANSATYRTLGPDLYSGTSGVALFLAELAVINGDATLRATALGAIRQAMSQLGSMSPDVRLGLFNGWLGIVLAAVRIGKILDSTAIRSNGISLLRQCCEQHEETQEFDLMSGDAGSIAALLALENMLADPALLELAGRLGGTLMGKAIRSDSGWSWQSPTLKTRRNLTGLSHGSAGCGFAFFELYHGTGQSSFRDAGRSAFQYEQACFDPIAKNWPDFRNGSGQRTKGWRPQCLSFWCHGAPGIGMTRLRACEILPDGAYRNEAAAAVETTAKSIQVAIDDCTGNFSLCHGLAGNGEVLKYGAEVLGDQIISQTLLPRLATYGLERFAKGNAPWPCGTHSGETPNLMLGLAGVGQFYLRMARPTIPSVLLLRKEAWV